MPTHELRPSTLASSAVLSVLALAALTSGAAGPPPSGRVVTLSLVQSPELGNVRNVFVYLPPSYDRGVKRYPVLYLQDGQNVFDPGGSLSGREWGADEAADALAARGVEAIVVGVANIGANRAAEYVPYAIDANDRSTRADRYATFLVKTLKPMIDGRFRTKPDRQDTGIGGSSFGAIVSLYAALQHPDTFGFVAAFSPSLWVADGAMLHAVQNKRFTSPLRAYVDIGTLEGSTPQEAALSVTWTRQLASLLERGGATVRLVVARDQGHNEAAWAARFPSVLEWFAGGSARSAVRTP
ncbi:alpha/beta hydrolase [Deinococcus yavapaiensis]|uniref:Putative alpha/beta superfamily hydrolase n=1 Tax=Deinococcus yavapaiensis KR-236 TaxID=694435 RepID=A0A318S3A7_9DEIO|nr:alpha/beta hydrolase-fold protein [Deinococcus yavapaiensis]PYE48666.1 putative alpha/beta superfamily hydrolase [Deinococcus yavapaiensis KR-236]